MADNKKRNLTEAETILKGKAKKLQSGILKQEQELQEVQNFCEHPKDELKFVSSNKGSSELKVVCQVCNKELRYPSVNDLEKNGYK